MAGNVIGTGAVVLSANSDALLSGLHKAEKATEDWARDTTKRASKAAGAAGGGGGGGGGLLGNLLGGAAVGGVAGLAAGAALSGLESAMSFISGLPEMLKSLQEASGQGDGGPLARMVGALDSLQQIGTQFLATVVSPMAPAFERVAQIAQGFWERLQPIAAALGQRIGGAVFSLVEMTGSWLNVFLTGLQAVWPILDKVFRAAEVGLFLFETLFTLVADGISWAIAGIAEWVGSWLNLDGVTLTVSQAIFKALRFAAEGAGYVWDAFKYGAGVVAEAAGHMIDAIQEIAKTSDELFGTEYAKKLDGAGAAMRAWGREARAGFGASASVFGAAIDGLQAKFEARRQQIEDAAHKAGDKNIEKAEPSGAMLAGSQEAISTVTKFQVGELFAAQNRALGGEMPPGKDPVALAQKQLDAQKDMRRILAKIEDGISGGQMLQVIP